MAQQGVFIGQVPTVTEANQAVNQEALQQFTLQEASRRQQEKNAALKAQQEEQNYLGGLLQKHTHENGKPDFDAIADEYLKAYPESGMKFKQAVGQMRSQAVDADRKEREARLQDAAVTARMLRAAMDDPTSYGMVRNELINRDRAAGQYLAPDFDPVAIGRYAALAEAEAGTQEKRLGALDLLTKGDVRGWVAQSLAQNVQSQEDLDEFYDDASAMFDRQALSAIKKQFGTQFDPEFNARAMQLAFTPQERVTNANTAADNARADAQLKVAQGQLGVAQGNLAARNREAQSGGAAGSGGGVKLAAGAIEKVAGVDQAVGMMDDIERLLPSMLDSVGPLDGRLAKGKLATGAGVTSELAEFDAQITGLKNAVIKATTGAAMSEPEAKRIMGQLPDLSQPEAVFKARLATTRRNLEMLKKRTIELSGGSVAPAAPPAGAKKLTAEELIKKYGGGG